jgi:hypothetical protein
MSFGARPGLLAIDSLKIVAPYTPFISSDRKPQLRKRHILANSSVDATIQRWIAARVLAVLRFGWSLTKARLQSALMEGAYSFFLPLVHFSSRVLMPFDIATVPLPVIVSTEPKG